MIQSRRRPGPSLLALAVGAVALAVLVAGCSSSDDEDSTTTTEKTTTTAAGESAETVKFDKAIQAELAEVGCYTGADDGIIGPETDAAILAFQKASGLSTDGELGPETEAALKTAVADGKKVCDGSSTTTTTEAGSTTTAPSGSGAPCTAAAISPAIAPSTLLSYQCGGGFASGAKEDGGSQGVEAAFLLQAEGGSWTVADLNEACASGNPLKIPQSVLAASPCEVS